MAESDAGLTGPSLADLATLVRDRRESLASSETSTRRGLSIREAARLSGMSAVTWSRIENGEEVRALSYTAAEPVLRWQPGSIRRYLDTGARPTDIVAESATTDAPRRTIYEFEFEELQAEIRRRYLALLERAGNLRPVEHPEETPASVEARGMLPGLPLPDEHAEDAPDDDVADGGIRG